MKDFQEVVDKIINLEKGYVNDSADKGGETNYGITLAVARDNGYLGPMRDMPRSLAESIYLKRYIKEPKFDQIFALDNKIGMELIDTGVNMGPSRASEFLQRWLNAFSEERLFVDGRLGNLTISCFRNFLLKRGELGRSVMFRALNGIQAVRYLEITEKDPSQKRFVFGWIAQRVS